MNLHIATPFGRRSLTAAQIGAQAKAAGCPLETTVHKWSVFRDIAAARGSLGLTDRTLTVLDALLTFHPETALVPGEGAALVVFPSNAALCMRAHGIAEPTLRRHLAILVEAGIVIRRDSPNGKRYARRGAEGLLTQAFGFDLTPIVARATEFSALAEAVRAGALALRIARERVTILRRDCAKSITALEEAEGAPGAAAPLRARYAHIVRALTRTPSLMDIEVTGEALRALAMDVGKLLIVHQENVESSGNAARNERHNHSSNTDTVDSELASELMKKDRLAPRSDSVEQTAEDNRTRSSYPLGLVLGACPDVSEFAREGIRSWRDLIETANLVRSALGISPAAWQDAQGVMGPDAAAVVVAAILQRAEHIKSPGGYLRSLVERKRAGLFSLGPVLQALMRARLKTDKGGGQGVGNR